MKKHSNSWICILLCLFLIGCEYEIGFICKDLTEKVEFKYQQSLLVDTGGVAFCVDTIKLTGTDKNSGYIPLESDELTVSISLCLNNNSNNDIEMLSNFSLDERNYSPYYCYYTYNEKLDSTQICIYPWESDTLLIKKKSKINIGLICEFANFEGLFGQKDDYTEDMLKLIETMYFKYDTKCFKIKSDSISFNDTCFAFYPNKNTKVFSINEKYISKFRKRICGMKDYPTCN